MIKDFKTLFYLVIILFNFDLFAQHGIGIELGYGTYSMEKMKDLQQYFIDNSGIPLTVNESFPSYPYYQLKYSYTIEKSEFGGNLRYASTGGRISYADFSGSLILDQLLQLYSFGVHYAHFVANDENWSIKLKGIVFYNYSNLNLDEELILYEEEAVESASFNSSGLSLVPLIQGDYRIFTNVFLMANLGVDINLIRQPFMLDGEKDAIISIPEGDLSPNWSGVRASIGIEYVFGRK